MNQRELKDFLASIRDTDIEEMRLESGVAMISKPVLPHAFLKKIRAVLDEGDQ